jgi:hypothetical protein
MAGNKAEDGTKTTVAAIQKEAIINSKRFRQYHPAMLHALLPKEAYTMAEAERIVGNYFSKGGKQ